MYISIKAYSKESFEEFHKIIQNNKPSPDISKFIIDRVRYKNIEITLYTTHTVLFKGDISNIKDEISILIDKKLYVGVDEVGVGENIGPLIVCIVRFKDYQSKLNVAFHGIKDSKKMSHQSIINASKVIKENAYVECVILEPKEFNIKYKQIQNMKALNALIQNKLHNNFSKYKDHVTDQFVNKNKYFEYLKKYNQNPYMDILFTTKAEDKFMEVAAAAIVAKSEYNNWLINYLEKNNIEYKINKKLNSNEIWNKIKKSEIIINNPDELIKDWSKK